MSGICAVAGFRGEPPDERAVRSMAAAAPHRCTGGTDVLVSGSAALAKLWRPGEGDGAASAITCEGSPVVVADARIDNRDELRSALIRLGHLRPGARGDTALLAAAYAAWGPAFPGRVVGDFAVVVWDPDRRRLVAARDPLGMRSLFLRAEPRGRVLVATEVKQLLAAPGVPAEVFEPAAAADLVAHFGRPEWSFYAGVTQLAPGWSVTVDVEGCREQRFWDIDGAHRLDVDSRQGAEALRRTFTESVAARLDAARPAGVLLSGGVDSGSVASVAGWLIERGEVRTPSLHAFCWAFDRLRECDERHVSRHVVERFGLVEHDIPADDAGPLACYPDHLPDRDDPMLGAFQPLIEHSLDAARAAGVGVLLGGDRGDLVIGPTGMSYVDLARAARWRDLHEASSEQRRATGDTWAVIAHRHLLAPVAARLRRRSPAAWLAWAAKGAARRRPSGVSAPDWVRASFLRDTGVDALVRAPEHAPMGLDAARRERYKAIMTPLHVRGMAWSERTYARYGIGFADPFSDRRLVELAVSLPPAVINRPGDVSKPLMREAVRGVMPATALAEAGTIVPRPLFDAGLREVAELIRTLLTEPQLEQRGWVDAVVMRDHFERWLDGVPMRPEFWWTLQVEVWLRAHWS